MNDRILIAGTHSGCGKTTVTTALLSAFKARGVETTAFKCGPDYIDPLFHRAVLKIPVHNLDPFFSPPVQLRALIAAQEGKLSVIEGVMGYYDGIGTEGRAGTYDAACATETPVILVINPKGMYTSAGAVLRGFLDFRRPSRITGVIFNGATPMMAKGLAHIAHDAGALPLGILPYDERFSIPGRHLGLYKTDELPGLEDKLRGLGELAERTIDIDGVLDIATDAAAFPAEDTSAPLFNPEESIGGGVRIAIARDSAFSSLYEENLDMLSALGGSLCFFSPMNDEALPPGSGGIYLPGGDPELYAEPLSHNTAMRRAMKSAIRSGMPVIAEGGGFLYLHDTLEELPMAGIIKGCARITKKLQTFGYMTLTAEKDNLLCRKGERMKMHTFHYGESSNPGNDFTAQKASGGTPFPCGHASDTLYAGFPHLYFPAIPQSVRRFVEKAARFAGLACCPDTPGQKHAPDK